jgi:hypothetical protein
MDLSNMRQLRGVNVILTVCAKVGQKCLLHLLTELTPRDTNTQQVRNETKAENKQDTQTENETKIN